MIKAKIMQQKMRYIILLGVVLCLTVAAVIYQNNKTISNSGNNLTAQLSLVCGGGRACVNGACPCNDANPDNLLAPTAMCPGVGNYCAGSQCMFGCATCGNKTVQQGEECDGGIGCQNNCQCPAGTTPTANGGCICNPEDNGTAYCCEEFDDNGDGVIQDPGEAQLTSGIGEQCSGAACIWCWGRTQDNRPDYSTPSACNIGAGFNCGSCPDENGDYDPGCRCQSPDLEGCGASWCTAPYTGDCDDRCDDPGEQGCYIVNDDGYRVQVGNYTGQLQCWESLGDGPSTCAIPRPGGGPGGNTPGGTGGPGGPGGTPSGDNSGGAVGDDAGDDGGTDSGNGGTNTNGGGSSGRSSQNSSGAACNNSNPCIAAVSGQSGFTYAVPPGCPLEGNQRTCYNQCVASINQTGQFVDCSAQCQADDEDLKMCPCNEDFNECVIDCSDEHTDCRALCNYDNNPTACRTQCSNQNRECITACGRSCPAQTSSNPTSNRSSARSGTSSAPSSKPKSESASSKPSSRSGSSQSTAICNCPEPDPVCTACRTTSSSGVCTKLCVGWTVSCINGVCQPPVTAGPPKQVLCEQYECRPSSAWSASSLRSSAASSHSNSSGRSSSNRSGTSSLASQKSSFSAVSSASSNKSGMSSIASSVVSSVSQNSNSSNGSKVSNSSNSSQGFNSSNGSQGSNGSRSSNDFCVRYPWLCNFSSASNRSSFSQNSSVINNCLNNECQNGGAIFCALLTPPQACINTPNFPCILCVLTSSNGSNGSNGSNVSNGSQGSNGSTGSQTSVTSMFSNGSFSAKSARSLSSEPPLSCFATCSNHLRECEEECDDGNRDNDDGCSNVCFLERGFCGDRIIQSRLGEECEPDMEDPGECDTRTCTFTDQSSSRTSFTCGDGRRTGSEECDDGNSNNVDSCDNFCYRTSGSCGDGIVQRNNNEECEPSIQTSIACSNSCRYLFNQPPPLLPPNSTSSQIFITQQLSSAGQSFSYPFTYDPRNPQVIAAGPICTTDADCPYPSLCILNRCLIPDMIAALPVFCGNARIDPGEGCDNGSLNSNAQNAQCRIDCTPQRCGDGITDTPLEQCDDGNLVRNDGCSPTCQPERTAPTQTLPATTIELPFTTKDPGSEIGDRGSEVGAIPNQPNAPTVPNSPNIPSTPDTGPAALAVMLAGAAAGWAFRKRADQVRK